MPSIRWMIASVVVMLPLACAAWFSPARRAALPPHVRLAVRVPVSAAAMAAIPELSKLPPEAAELDLRSDRPPGEAPSCQSPVAPLPACAPGFAAGAQDWSEVVARAPALLRQTIRVRGALGLSDLPVPLGHWRFVTAPAVVAGVPPLVLADTGERRGYEYGCWGFDGQLCCDVPAFGQAVVATGQLWTGLSDASPWALVDVSLCEERQPPR